MMNPELVLISQKAAQFARIQSLIMTSTKRTSHVGSCFSVIDLLSALFALKTTSEESSRDTILLSKGHAAAALYAVLESFKLIDAKLTDFCEDNSMIYGHVNHHASSEIPLSTGSLGHGLPFAIGVALSNKLRGNNQRTFVVISDGELNEGTTWESALFAGHHILKDLVVLIDRNRIQSLGLTDDVLRLDPLDDKFKSFNWEVVEIDGHSHDSIISACQVKTSKPLCIIANTVKGKGVSFMENSIEWHYKSANETELEKALLELNKV